MSVSVVVPIYQRQDSAVCAIRSALDQQPAPSEVIAVDDGSPTPFVLPADLRADPRVKLLRHAANGGAAAARNTGIAAARSDWIALLDSDDRWLPRKLAAQLALVADAPVTTAIVTGFRRIHGATGRLRTELPKAARTVEDFASGCWFCPGSTALVHRQAFALVGGYDVALPRLEDFDWFLRLGLAGGRVEVARCIGAEIAIGGKPAPDKVDASVAMLRAKWLERSPRRLSAPAARRCLAYLQVERASAYFAAGRWPACAAALARSLAAYPRRGVHLQRWWTPYEDTAAAAQ